MSGTKILVVEDSATQATALALLLERADFEVAIARRGERALEILADQPIELVLSDVVMPGMDGYELCRRIKNEMSLDIPVVLLTSLTDPLAIVRGLEAGADHYVTKPYEPEGLIARVKAVLARARQPGRAHTEPFTVELLGTPFTISATREQILELLVSSYSDLVRTSEAVRDAERRARFLAEATELLSASLDVRLVLRDLVKLVVPRIADVCTATLFEGEKDARRVELAHAFSDIELDTPATTGNALQPMSDIAARAVSERAIQAVSVASRDQLREVVRDDRIVAELESIGPFSLIVMPLVSRDRVNGLLHFLIPTGSRAQAPETILLIEDLSRRASVALENALLYTEAQRATRARDDMLAIVSHDLKNPLNTIQMSAAFLLDLLAQPGAVAPVVPQLQLIRRATARGNALIQDLLDVSRIESGTLAVDAKPTSASGLLMDAVPELAPLADGKDIALDASWQGPDVEVRADKDRIAQVFSNLVGNAIKFTPRGGQVRVTGRADGTDVRFDVADTGAGIDAADVPHLFDRFWKVAKASRSGAGLGLYIVKGIVEGHGGSIAVRSTLGEGTSITFTLHGATTGEL